MDKLAYVVKFLKSHFKKIAIISSIGVLLVGILGAFLLNLDVEEGIYKAGDESNVPYSVSEYIKTAKIGDTGIEFDMTVQELWDKLIKNGSEVASYLSGPEALEKLINAEIVTQYPKFGKGGLDGIIEIKRADTNSNTTILTYVDEETFNSYIEEYNSNGNSENASKCYTIDERGNMLLAQWTKMTTEVTTTIEGEGSSTTTSNSYYMTPARINYKSVVQKYTMPFNYLWAFLVISDCEDLVLDLADYVLQQSEITITGFESESTSEESYDEEETINVSSTETDPNTGEDKTVMQQKKKTITTKTIVNSNTINVELNKANTWIIDYEKKFSDTYPYVEQGVTQNIKTDSESEEDNFIVILNRYINARKNIIECVGSLFEILESNNDTANMVDLTKYLLYKATGKNYGVTEFDFNEYEPGSMKNITMGSGGGASYESLNLTDNDLQILYKITSAERGGGTQEQQEYVVSVILNRVLSSRFPNTVHDVVFAPMQFQPTRNGAYDKANPSATTIAAVDNVVQNGDKARCAVYFMTPAASLGQPWLSNCEFLFNDEDDSLKDTNTNGTHNFYTTPDVINELQQYMTVGNGSIVDVAVSLHKELRENGYTYQQKGITLPNTSGRTIDCSSYVTWVLLNVGVQGFSNGMYQWTSISFQSNPQGWQEVSVQDAQPGDILVYSRHVEIVAANTNDSKFIVYNCGGNSSIGATGISGLPESSTSGHTKSQITKILRVP